MHNLWMISPKDPSVEYTTQGLKLFTQQISDAMKLRYGASAGMIGTAVKYEFERWRGGYMASFGTIIRASMTKNVSRVIMKIAAGGSFSVITAAMHRTANAQVWRVFRRVGLRAVHVCSSPGPPYQ